MQFLSISRRRTDKFTDADFAALFEVEVEQAKTLYTETSLRQIWRRGSSSIADSFTLSTLLTPLRDLASGAALAAADNRGTFANVRAGYVEKETNWQYSGEIDPGYPDLNPLDEGYWELFWKLYITEREKEPPPQANPPLR